MTDFFCDVFLITFYSLIACKGAWYFIALMVIADIFRFILRGAWYYAPFHETAHYHDPAKDPNAAVLACIKISGIILLLAISLPIFIIEDIPPCIRHIRSWLWYIIVIATVIETFRRLLHTLHKHNKDWLIGSRGKIGIANWVSISRIAISFVMPHVYMTQSFGENSNIIATTVLIIAIGTDAIDGFVARQTGNVTKVGKYLDPLGDKIIFIPNAIAFLWMIYQNSLDGSDLVKRTMVVTMILIGITAARDILFFLWFFIMGRKLPRGLSASLVDKIRMAYICAWLLATALNLSIPGDNRLVITSLSMCIISAILSIISVEVDYERYRRALEETSHKRRLR